MHDTTIYILASFVAFFAGFIDSVAGGGGTIQIPALLLLGIPPIMTLGTNKMVAFCGTAIATARYSMSIAMPWKTIILSIPVAAICALGGAKFILLFDPEIVNKIIIFTLPVAFVLILIFSRKEVNDTDSEEKFKKKSFYLSTAIFSFYDGYFGPGTGSFLATSYNKLSKIPFVIATACAKPINLTANVTVLAAFIIYGQYRLDLALPMMAFNALGAYIGSTSTIRLGGSFVRNLLIASFALLIIDNLLQLVFHY